MAVPKRTIGFMILAIVLGVLQSNGRAFADVLMNVSGKAVDLSTGSALSKVRLVLMSKTAGKIAETDSTTNGNFIFRGIKSGSYDLLASSDDEFIIDSKTTVPVTVQSGKNVIGVTVKLQRGGAITGRLITNTGYPIKQAKIIGGGATATVDANGYFTLKGTVPGTIQIGIIPVAINAKQISVKSEAGKITNTGNIVLSVGIETAIQGTVTDTSGNALKGAILIAYKDNASAGYAFSDSKGYFFITGLTPGIHSLYVVVFGYEQQTITNIVVPTDTVKIVMNRAQTQSSSMEYYRFATLQGEHKSLLSHVLDLFAVKEAIASDDFVNKYCQDGTWVGSSVDLAALSIFPNLLGPGSGTGAATFSIGSYYCWNSSANLQFYMPCTYIGATTGDQPSSLDLGIGITPFIGVWGACYTRDILGHTDGVVAGLGTTADTGFKKVLKKVGVTGSVGYDWGGPVTYLSFSLGAGIPALDMLIDGVNGWTSSGGNINPEGSDIFISYRSCDTNPAENVFEWWTNFFSNLF